MAASSSISRFAAALEATIPRYDASDCLRALEACIALYRDLREADANAAAESAVMAYMGQLKQRL